MQKYQYIRLLCIYLVYRVTNFNYRWIAVDDSRIKVLNDTLDVTPDSGKGQNVYSHGLTNAKLAFPTFTHFTTSREYNVLYNISLEVNSVTSTDVTLSNEVVGGVIRTLGFQIIIGTEAAFMLIKKLELQNPGNMQQQIFKPLKYSYFFGMQYFNYKSVLETFQILRSGIDPGITFGLDASLCSGCKNVTFQVVVYNQYEVDLPLLCSKMRIAKKKQTFAVPFQVYLQVNGDKNQTIEIMLDCEYGAKEIFQIKNVEIKQFMSTSYENFVRIQKQRHYY